MTAASSLLLLTMAAAPSTGATPPREQATTATSTAGTSTAATPTAGTSTAATPTAGTPTAGTGADGSLPLPTATPGTKPLSGKLVGPVARHFTGTKQVFVQFAGSGAADTASGTIKQGKGKVAAKQASQARKAATRATTAEVVAAAKSKDKSTKVLWQVSNAVPGVAIAATEQALQSLVARPDVVKISALVPKKVTNANTAQLVKALNTWHDVGNTGAGVKVGVIDTGIDYTHADFGGPGTIAAWTAAHANSAAKFTPTAKVVGGTDFVGDNYNADTTAADYQPVPHPDKNPLDCESHGTHVSGTVAGYGVAANGKTFKGSYAGLTGPALMDMKIGPGMAPMASLYALKVFGCTGSTDAVIPALDWALDPNGDGDFSDHLDVVNMSLGSDYATPDDPENDVVDELSANGVLSVIAMGNNGDLTDTGGAPGNAISSLAVASTVDSFQLRDGLRVEAPANLKGIVAGQFSVAYAWKTKAPVTGTVVTLSPDNADGCAKVSAADALKIKGKVAWLIWDDNDATRRCGSVGRSGNVAAAGAIGAIFTSGRNVFGAGITGSADIPVVQLPKVGTDKLAPAVAAGTLKVTFDGKLQATIKDITPSISDTLSSFSSRGTHGAPGVVKPDVAAPGDTIASAGMGSGNGVLVISGTSMATPLTAGVAALVKKMHPTWTPEQLKAAVMNTATHDVYSGENKSGPKYGPARVGAGRIDALAAVSTKVLAYNVDQAGAVSASFGAVEAPITSPTVTRTQTIRIQNTATKPVTVQLAYEGIVSQPGVSYTVSPTTLTVKASGSGNATVKMTITTAKLRRTIDPTMATEQTDPNFGDLARQYVSDASGHVLVKQLNKTSLRVPVYGAAKPVSKTTAVAGKTTSGRPAIVVKGVGVNQGSGSTAYQSKLSVMDLGYRSPKEPVCLGASTAGCVSNASTRSGDIQYVGAGATVSTAGSKADGWLYFGVSTYGNWATVGNSLQPYVDIDTDGDGAPDFEAVVRNTASTDLLLSYVYDLNSGDLVDVEPINFNLGDVDTNVFDTNTVLIPVSPKAIGMVGSPKSFPISYNVGTSSFLGSPETNGDIDHTPAISFDAAAPKIQVAGPLYLDKAGATIRYTVNQARTGSHKPAAKPVSALIFHLGGASGARAQVLKLKG